MTLGCRYDNEGVSTGMKRENIFWIGVGAVLAALAWHHHVRAPGVEVRRATASMKPEGKAASVPEPLQWAISSEPDRVERGTRALQIEPVEPNEGQRRPSRGLTRPRPGQ
ncbi:MAG: hypothetical protein IT285_05260 [Bdellovibrionales bacterium]|nr:hypothetical protein [Bdellovibrionales bacterium]